jgi:hypothetical protein
MIAPAGGPSSSAGITKKVRGERTVNSPLLSQGFAVQQGHRRTGGSE